MHLQPSEALRSDPLPELNTFIYSFWTLESLTGVHLPIGVHPDTLLQIKTVTKCFCPADCRPSATLDPTPRLQAIASWRFLLPSGVHWARPSGGARPASSAPSLAPTPPPP
jgi:hypothetical protein